jgi:hypothetical protein
MAQQDAQAHGRENPDREVTIQKGHVFRNGIRRC